MSMHFKSFQSWGFSSAKTCPYSFVSLHSHWPIANPPVLQFQHWLSMNQQECGRCSQKCPFNRHFHGLQIMAGCFKRKTCHDSQPWHPQLELFSGDFAGDRFIAWFFWWFQNGGKHGQSHSTAVFVTNSVFYWVVGSTQIVVNKKIFPKINMGKNCLESPLGYKHTYLHRLLDPRK